MSRATKKIGILDLALALIALGLSTAGPALSADSAPADDYVVDTSSINSDGHGVITSDQFLELGVPDANALRMEGENALKYGKVDRAIMVLQRAVEMQPRDMDGRILYSEALEKKLLKQKERDPRLYNFLLKQWLFIGKNAEYADQGQQGYNHLYKLCGVVPKRFEKEKKFLEHVLIPEDGSVKVVIGKRDGKGHAVDNEPIAHHGRLGNEEI
jgi:hypothetical protein